LLPEYFEKDNPTMTPQDVDKSDPRQFESACRDFWIEFVKMEIGEHPGEPPAPIRESVAIAAELNA
jgi:hypothetical protein